MKQHAERIDATLGTYDAPAEPGLVGPALRAFFNLAERWKLRVADQRKLLGDPPESTFYKWKRERDGTLSRDTLERISYLLGIF
jgi:hypothetical protein